MKITLNNVGSLIDATTAANIINGNNATVQVAFDNTLSRDGSAPNQMEAALDMNSQPILNLPAPVSDNSPLRLQDLESFVGGGVISGLPSGGVTGQVLAKNSNTSYDVKWGNSVTSVGLALPSDLTITNSPVVTTGTLTGAWAVTPTGTGSMVRSTSPTLITPALGTPSAVVLTNATGTASGLTAGHVTTNANLTGPITSVGNATSVAAQTGTGSTFVMNTSPTLVTPNLGTPSAVVLTNATGTAAGLTAGTVTTNANLTGDVTSVGNATTLTNAPVIAKVLTGYVSGAGTISATDSILSAIQKLNGNNDTNANLTGPITSVGNSTSIASQTGTGTTFAMSASPTFTGTVTVPTPFKVGAISVTSTGTQLNYLNAATGTTGTTSTNIVFSTSPVLVTPNLGTPSAAILTSATGLPISTGLTGAGTGVLTALGVNVGTAGSFIVNGGALGTPSSGVGTNITNVNAATLGGATFAAPGAIGGGTASAGTFTNVIASTINTAGGNLSIGSTSTVVSVVGTTVASSTTTGALTVAGGFGAAGKGYFGDDLSARDVMAFRNATTGYLFLGSNGVHYIGFDGTSYQMPSGGITIGGTIGSSTAPTAVSGAGPILVGSGSTMNSRMKVTLNGTDYWIPCSTTAF